MRKISRRKQLYLSYRAKIKHKKYLRRKYAKGNRRFTTFQNRPELSDVIKYLASKENAFSNEYRSSTEDGRFLLPEIFSLTENYAISFSFLKRLFFALYYQSAEQIILDYKKCLRIDLDASVCMDILLREFIKYFENCRRAKHFVKIQRIYPINFGRDEIIKVLFSIGTFPNIKGVNIKFPDIIPYRLCIGHIKHPKASQNREVHITEMVTYVLTCMNKMNRTLTAEAEDNLFKVIGEVLINAEEHSSVGQRFSIGYFQDTTQENGEHIGVFNLVILNFGKTIYEMFSDPNCPNSKAVSEMKDLSGKYTTKKFFTESEFEEETLWTLYALQEGVTSKKDWRRGNGSIRFVESFFNLKGDNLYDDISYLSIVSGNTRIIFDGKYRLVEKIKGKDQRKYKIMAFNEKGEIENKPDKKYVTFVKNYFPGTIISAKISIKEINVELSNE